MTRMLQLAWAALLPRRRVPGRGILEPSVTRMRVWPQDLDLYGHVNNGSYLQMMDVARSNLMADAGAFEAAKKHDWYPVVAASTMKYRRSLQPFERFEITSRMLGWDERCVYIEQVFTCKGSLCARGVVAGRFLDRKGNRIPAPDVIAAYDPALTSPELPEDVASWARVLDVAPRPGERADLPK